MDKLWRMAILALWIACIEHSAADEYESLMDRITLRRVVVLSHHGLPEPDYNALQFNDYTPNSMQNASSTTNGAVLSDAGRLFAVKIGQYYRKAYYECAGLVDGICDESKVFVSAKGTTNASLGTAQAFLKGLLPNCTASVDSTDYHPEDLSARTNFGETEGSAGVFDMSADEIEAVASLSKLVECCEREAEQSYVCGDDIAKTLDGCDLTDLDIDWEGDECYASLDQGDICPTYSGGLRVSEAFAETFLRQALNAGELPGPDEIAWGQLTLEEAIAFSSLSEAYRKTWFNAENLGRLGWYFPFQLIQQLKSAVAVDFTADAVDTRLAAFFANELQMQALKHVLGIDWEIPGWLAGQVPFGGAVVAEVFEEESLDDADGSESSFWVKLVFVAGTPQQMQKGDLSIGPNAHQFENVAVAEQGLKGILRTNSLPTMLDEALQDADVGGDDNEEDDLNALCTANNEDFENHLPSRTVLKVSACGVPEVDGRLCRLDDLLAIAVAGMRGFAVPDAVADVLVPMGWSEDPPEEGDEGNATGEGDDDARPVGTQPLYLKFLYSLFTM